LQWLMSDPQTHRSTPTTKSHLVSRQ
jgi:hypothetical protein